MSRVLIVKWIGVLIFIVFIFHSIINVKAEEYPVITIENVTHGENFTGTSTVEDALNEILIPELGCKIKIVNCNIHDHYARIMNMVKGESQMDIINSGLTTSLSELVSAQIVTDLSELIQIYGSDLLEKEKRVIAATTIQNKIYGVPANIYCSKAMGIGYNLEMAQKLQIELRSEMPMDQLTEIGEKLKKEEIYLTSCGDGGLTSFPAYFNLEDFGGDLNYGVIFEPAENLMIENVYESEQYQHYCETLQNWRKEGYLPGDTLWGGLASENLFYTEKSFYEWTSVSPSTQRVIQAKHLSHTQELLPFTQNIRSTASVLENVWSITSFCERPDLAMQVLNLMYTDERISNLLQNGVENLNYRKVTDDVIEQIVDETGNPSYATSFSCFGDLTQIKVFQPVTGNFTQMVIDFDSKAKESKSFGYVFDTSEVLAEIAAVTSVVSVYRPILETGMADDVSALLNEFQAELKKAGMDKIIEENQRQFLLWLKTKDAE